MKKRFENSARDEREDKAMAKKRGMTMAAWEKSAANKKHDIEGQKNMAKKRMADGGEADDSYGKQMSANRGRDGKDARKAFRDQRKMDRMTEKAGRMPEQAKAIGMRRQAAPAPTSATSPTNPVRMPVDGLGAMLTGSAYQGRPAPTGPAYQGLPASTFGQVDDGGRAMLQSIPLNEQFAQQKMAAQTANPTLSHNAVSPPAPAAPASPMPPQAQGNAYGRLGMAPGQLKKAPMPTPTAPPPRTAITPDTMMKTMKRGGAVKAMKAGGMVRGNGCATRGKTRGRMV